MRELPRYIGLFVATWMIPAFAMSALAAGSDLALTVSATPESAVVNGDVTFSMRVRNAGPKAAKKIVLTDLLPQGSKLKSASPSCRFLNSRARRLNRLTCKAARVGPGAETFWSAVVTHNATGVIRNSASVKFSGRDTNRANNAAWASAKFGPANRAPEASPLTFGVNSAQGVASIQLIGKDPDNSVVTFDLLSARSGSGYSVAAFDPVSGGLVLNITPGYVGTITLSYRVTDGSLFSPEALVQMAVSPDFVVKGTGAQPIDPKAYAAFDKSRLSPNLLGAPGTAPTEPASVDLSGDFPSPGDQGEQGSCVAWATGYALKSYQEAVEMGWSPNTTSHVFSPAFIYNQINRGRDNGSQIYDALDLIINQGAATWRSMPYDDSDYFSQPSAAVRSEASAFKGVRKSTLTSLSDLKGALAQRRPVVLGIEVYDQFYRLSGANSVYNSKAGNNNGPHGRHAVTAVGYDNNRYGGAIKVINSWGTGWGDGGFFWMPYSFLPQVVFQMWVLEDGENGNIAPDPNPQPPVNGDLPDFQIKTWRATWDSTSPGGQGHLAWEIVNSGRAVAPKGATVSLMLSKDANITAADTFVVYEPIIFDLGVGGSVYRRFGDLFTKDNTIPFRFPQTIAPGTYYMALLVDDVNSVPELNEANNVSLGEDTLTFGNSLPDLSIDNWYADWSDNSGAGTLTYSVSNVGGQDAPAGWYLSLMLSDSEALVGDDVDTWWLSVQQRNAPLKPREVINFGNTFNVHADIDGEFIPAGFYYMALWADDTDIVKESDELNNISYDWAFTANAGTNPETQVQTPSTAAMANNPDRLATGHSAAYNGRKLPQRAVAVRRVKISETANGQRTLEMFDELPASTAKELANSAPHGSAKTMQASNPSMFPTVQSTPMPPIGE